MEAQLLRHAMLWAREAGTLMKKMLDDELHIEQKKNDSDLVTQADRRCEELLRNRLAQVYPGHWILGEEMDGGIDSYTAFKQRGGGYGWIIDPIDGTTNYIHRIPHFAVSIGIVKDGQPVAGVVYNPLTDELFHAVKGGGAYLNDARIQVSQKERRLSEAVLATGFYAGDWHEESEALPQIKRFVGSCRNLRMNGAASLDLCWVACGRLTGFWHRGLHPWDAAAGSLIVTEAGGRVTDRFGAAFHLAMDSLVATNGWTHDEITSIFLMDVEESYVVWRDKEEKAFKS
ncbi:inositol monophosphatase family protein [Paenibacillus sambharensis]|nr:inositol monophosphatase family protein [Paenibacillus sambharensis]